MKTDVDVELVDSIGGAIGRVWKVDGITQWPKTFDKARVLVRRKNDTHDDVVLWAKHHELGHVEDVEGLVNAFGSKTTGEIFDSRDKFSPEVEAWMYGIELIGANNGTLSDPQPFWFALDCLNSYRRHHKVGDDEWEEAVRALAGYYDGDERDLLDYVPLEPDKNEPSPSGCSGGFAIVLIESESDEDESDEDESDEDESDEDESDEDESEDDEDEESPEDDPELEQGGGGEGDPIKRPVIDDVPDEGWLEQAPVDEIVAGASVEDVAVKYGLDPSRLPPLVKALLP